MKFGRKEVESKDVATNGQTVHNESYSNGTSSGSRHMKNTSDLAVYEQYRNQVPHD